MPLRRFGAIVGGGTPSADPENWGGDVPFVTPPDLRPVVGGIVEATQRTLTDVGVATGSSLAPPDSVILSIRAPIGYVARTASAMAFNQGCRAIIPNESTCPRYLTYALMAAKPELDANAQGTTFAELSASRMAAIELPAPRLEVQQAIAHYIDAEIGKIDELITEQQCLVDTLMERRDAVAAQYFVGSQGKRSTSVRRVLRPLARPAVAGLGVITAYRDGVVTLRSNRRDDGYTFSDTEYGYQEIRPGDIVFHALDGFAGAIGISDSHGNATPVYHACEAIAGDDPSYIAMLLRYLGVSGFLATQAPNVRERSVDFRNWTMLARIPLDLPPPDDQRAAVAEIQTQTARIDTLVAATERFIELSRERRSALITAAVTGQIDMRKAEA